MDHFEISLHLFVRRKRMDGAELGPCHRDHLARRVELHRARTEWDHRAIEREILVGQAAQIAQHLVLAVVAMKHRMREDLVDSSQCRWQAGYRRLVEVDDGSSDAEGRPDRFDGRACRGLVERDTDGGAVDETKVEAARPRRRGSNIGIGDADEHGVEERTRHHLDAAVA